MTTLRKLRLDVAALAWSLQVTGATAVNADQLETVCKALHMELVRQKVDITEGIAALTVLRDAMQQALLDNYRADMEASR